MNGRPTSFYWYDTGSMRGCRTSKTLSQFHAKYYAKQTQKMKFLIQDN